MSVDIGLGPSNDRAARTKDSRFDLPKVSCGPDAGTARSPVRGRLTRDANRRGAYRALGPAWAPLPRLAEEEVRISRYANQPAGITVVQDADDDHRGDL